MGLSPEAYERQLAAKRSAVPRPKVRAGESNQPESTVVDDEPALPFAIRMAIERAYALHAVEEGTGIHNPDLWSENDERSLMVLGTLDSSGPRGGTDVTWRFDMLREPRLASVRRSRWHR